MTLPEADKLAAQIVAALQPFAERIEIAGSIRRRRPVCQDVDLVILPKPNQYHALRARCKQNAAPLREGPDLLSYRLKSGIQLDVFLCEPDNLTLLESVPTNFGSVWLCRTGSAAHNIWLIEHAKLLGVRWNPHRGVFGPRGWRHELPAELRAQLAEGSAAATVCLASATEADIFGCLGLEAIAPEKRER